MLHMICMHARGKAVVQAQARECVREGVREGCTRGRGRGPAQPRGEALHSTPLHSHDQVLEEDCQRWIARDGDAQEAHKRVVVRQRQQAACTHTRTRGGAGEHTHTYAVRGCLHACMEVARGSVWLARDLRGAVHPVRSGLKGRVPPPPAAAGADAGARAKHHAWKSKQASKLLDALPQRFTVGQHAAQAALPQLGGQHKRRLAGTDPRVICP